MNKRKRQVLEHAQQLFLEKGATSTSIQDILTRANISKGTFYNYFNSKNDCLKDIVTLGEEETRLLRDELLIDQNPTNKDIFVQQIAVRVQVNHDHNLIPIIEAIFHSGDKELSEFARKSHLKELYWIANRLVDIYGEKMQTYAADCAVLLVGMLQHSLYFRKSAITKSYDPIDVTHYIMRRIDQMIPGIIATDDALFGASLFQIIRAEKEAEGLVKEDVMARLDSFKQQLEGEKDEQNLQYIGFLQDELHSETPRLQLVESVLRSCWQAFENTSHEYTVMKLISDIWIYIQAEA